MQNISMSNFDYDYYIHMDACFRIQNAIIHVLHSIYFLFILKKKHLNLYGILFTVILLRTFQINRPAFIFLV